MNVKRWRIACIFGTRPEAIKMAPVVLGLRASAEFEPVVIVTAQHREMLDQVLDLFGIVPDVDLNILRPGQTLTGVTTSALSALDPVLTETAPDVVLVQGDTTTTFVGALQPSTSRSRSVTSRLACALAAATRPSPRRSTAG